MNIMKQAQLQRQIEQYIINNPAKPWKEIIDVTKITGTSIGKPVFEPHEPTTKYQNIPCRSSRNGY